MTELPLSYTETLNSLVFDDASFLLEKRKEASHFLHEKGFPTRRDEDWKYTSADAFLKAPFSMTMETLSSVQHSPHLSDAYVIHCGGGSVTFPRDLPKGVILSSLRDACREHAGQVEPLLGNILEISHGFQAFNLATFQSGVFLLLEPGIHLQKPIVFMHSPSQSGKMEVMRHLVVLSERSECQLLHCFLHESVGATNVVTEIALSKHSKLFQYGIETSEEEAFHFSHIAVRQDAESHFESHQLSLGAKLARSDLSVLLEGSYANCLLNGMYYLRQNAHLDHHTWVFHCDPNTTSSEDYRGVLSDASRGVFNGKVLVKNEAKGSVAKQQNKNLLLSQQAEINTKPELSIFADDVQCSHGATVGQIDEDALFYMATRGIDRVSAINELIKAFLMTHLEQVPYTEIAAWMARELYERNG